MKEIDTLQSLIDLKISGNEIIYNNTLNSGILRRIDFTDDCISLIVKMNEGNGVNGLSEFKFYRTKPRDVYLKSFYYKNKHSEK